jgi:hypothetical protein
MYIHDADDGKDIRVERTGDDISVKFKDGTTQVLRWEIWRSLSFVIQGMTDKDMDNGEEETDH